MKKAIVFGATGLIGSHLLRDLLDNPDYERVIAVARNEELERLPGSLLTRGLVFPGDRRRGVAGHRHGGGAPRLTAFIAFVLAAVVCIGFPDHGGLFSDGQTIRPGEHRQGPDETD